MPAQTIEDKAEKSSSLYNKDIDSDNKSELSDDSNGPKIKRDGRKSKQFTKKEQTQINVDSVDKGSAHNSSQSRIEIRGVETIEEFFRPEFA